MNRGILEIHRLTCISKRNLALQKAYPRLPYLKKFLQSFQDLLKQTMIIRLRNNNRSCNARKNTFLTSFQFIYNNLATRLGTIIRGILMWIGWSYDRH